VNAEEFERAQREREYFHRLTVLPGAWTVLRLDGRGFSGFTQKQFDKPFDARFSDLMVATTETLLNELGAQYAYTESDEISLLLHRGFDLFGRGVDRYVNHGESVMPGRSCGQWPRFPLALSLMAMWSKVLVVVGAVIALIALAAAFTLPYGFVAEYGGSDLVSYAMVALVATPFVALGAWLAFRRALWALGGGLVLSLAAALGGGMFGQAAHDSAQEARAGACQADELSEFQALGAIETNGEYGWGNSDGSCRAGFGGRTQSSLDELRQAIEGRGWKPDGTDAYARDGKNLRIEIRDEGEKGLDITLNIP